VVGSFFVMLARRTPASWHRMLEYGWLWWYARMWYRHAANRAHLRRLAALQRPGAPRR
jgi:hypothetical protein